jgi:hypothetical protein
MLLTSWMDFLGFIGKNKKKSRKPAEPETSHRMADAVRLEVLEDRALLSAVMYNSATQQLSLTADPGVDDNVQITQLDASTLQIQVSAGDAMSLQGDAAANPDFVLTSPTTVTINTSQAHAIVEQLSIDLGDGTNHLNAGGLSLGGISVFNGGTVSLGALTVDTGGLTVIGQNITVNDPILANHGGGVTLVASGSLSSSNDNLTINADIHAQGSTPGGDHGTINLMAGNDLLIHGAALSTVGNGVIEAAAGSTLASGVLTMSSGATVQSDAGEITLSTAGTGTLTTLGITTNAADLVLTSVSGSVDLNGTTTNAVGNVSVSAGNNIHVNATVSSTGTGNVTLAADSDLSGSGTVELAAGASVVATQGNVTISGSDADLSLGSISAQAGQVHLMPAIPGANVDIGTDVVFGLTLADLQQISAGTLLIGSTTSGNVLVSAAIHDLVTSALGISSGGSILQQAGATLQVGSLGIIGKGPVILNGANQVGTLAVDQSQGGSNASFAFTNAQDLTIGSAVGVTGIATHAAAVNLRVSLPGGLLSVNQPISTGTGGPISFSADNLALNASVNAGTSQVFVQPQTGGVAINLGTETAGSLSLTNTELNQVTANLLLVGNPISPLTGAVTISAPLAPTGVSRFAIVNVDSIIDQNADGVDITVPKLMLETTNGIASTGTLRTAVAGLEAMSVNGDISIENTGDLTIGGLDDSLQGLSVQNSGSIRLTNHGSVFLGEADNTSIHAGTQGGDIIVQTLGADSDIVGTVNHDLVEAPLGSISLTAGRDFEAGTAGLAYDNDIEANKSITIIAGRDVVLGGDADVRSDDYSNNTGGSIIFTAGRNVTLQGASGTAAIPEIRATGSQHGNVQITTGSDGVLTLAAPDSAANSQMVSTDSGDLTLNADRIVISGWATVQAAGTATIAPRTAGRTIDLGSTTDLAAGTLELSNAEVNHIAAGVLRIGSSQSGDLNVTALISMNNVIVPVFSLISGGTVSDQGVGTLGIDKLRVSAQGDILLDNDGNHVNTVALQSASGEISFLNGNDLRVGTVDGVNGASTVDHALSVGTSLGWLTVSNTPAAHDLDSGTGELTFGSLSPAGVILASGANARGLGGVLVIGNQQQLDGTITATGQQVVLGTGSEYNTALPAIPIDLGGADSPTQLGISDAELDRIDAGVITVSTLGGSGAGAIHVTGQITLPQTTTLLLVGGSVVQNGGSIAAAKLGLYTLTGAGDGTPLQTQVSQLAFFNQTSGDVAINNTGALTLAGVDFLGDSQNAGGSAVVTSTGLLTIADNLTANGDVVLSANESIDAGDDLTINQGVSVVSLQGNITASAGDSLRQLGSLTVQAAGAAITLSGGKDDADGTGAVVLSGDLNTNDTSPQIFGGTGSDTITINYDSGIASGGGVVGLNIDGGHGNDTYILNFNHGPFTRDIEIDDASGAADQLQIVGKATDDTVTYDSTLAFPTVVMNDRTVKFAGLESANINAGPANADVLHIAENVAGFIPSNSGSIDTVVPLTFSQFETVTIPNTLPTVSGLSVTSSVEGGTATLTGSFDDFELHLGQTFILNVDWGDGTPIQNIPVTFTMANQNFSVTHSYVDDNPSGTSQDDYTVSVTVTDDNGGASLAGTAAATVQNVSPTIFVLNFSTAVDEGGTLTFTGTYTDVGTADTHQLLVDWNDGTPVETYSVSGGVFAVSHVYADEDLSGTAGDVRFPTLTIQDDDGGTAVSHPQVLVHNVAPSIDSLNVGSSVVEGSVLTLTGTYSDAGTADTHTLQIDWGDASGMQTIAVSGGQFSVQHTYADDAPTGTSSDPVTITATLADDDGASVTQTTTTTVTNADPTLINATITTPVAENGIVTLAGDIADAGVLDTHTLEVDWGDGSPIETFQNVGPHFSVTHQYLDDSPTGTGQDTANVSIRITDDDTGSYVVTVPVSVVNINPSIDSLQLSASDIDENGTVTLTGTYSDVGTLDTHTLRINWGDNQGNQIINVSGGTFSVSHQYLDDRVNSAGMNTMFINVVLVDDDLGTGIASTQVTVHNLNPVASIQGAPETSPEGTAIALTSSVTDPGTLDTQTYAWSVTKNGAAFATGTNANFTFTPDDAGTYVVNLVVTDDDAGTGTAQSKTIAVTEVAPTVGITGPASVAVLNPVQYTLTTTDPSSADQAGNFTFGIDWNGDGTVDQTVVGPSGTVVTHAFTTVGTSIVRVTATDKDSTTSSVVTKSVTVAPFTFIDGILTVGGTSSKDSIKIKDLGNGSVQVSLNGTSLGKFTPQVIRIHGGDGDDKILADSTLRVPVVLYGDGGNDQLRGGKGDDLLDGGAGNDKLQGGRGNDILVGGADSDNLAGGDGNDLVIGGLGTDQLNGSGGINIVIGGATSHDASTVELNAIRAELILSNTIDQKVDHLKNGGGANGQVKLQPLVEVTDDGVQDIINGNQGSNWLLSFISDKLKGGTRSSNRNN